MADLWRSEREEFRVEARQFVTEAVAAGHGGFESALPVENAGTCRSKRGAGASPLLSEHCTTWIVLQLRLQLRGMVPPFKASAGPSV